MASVARYCCCGPCPSIEITFSGVDAAICDACVEGSGPIADRKRTAVNLDGTYAVPLYSHSTGTIFTPETCEYRLLVNSVVLADLFSNTGTPCTTLIGDLDQDATIHVYYRPATQKIARVLVGVSAGDEVFEVNATGSPFALGTAQSNELTCPNGASDGGTVEVSIP